MHMSEHDQHALQGQNCTCPKISSRENKCKIFGKQENMGTTKVPKSLSPRQRMAHGFTWGMLSNAFRGTVQMPMHAVSQHSAQQVHTHAHEVSEFCLPCADKPLSRASVDSCSSGEKLYNALTSNLGHLAVRVTRGGHTTHTHSCSCSYS